MIRNVDTICNVCGREEENQLLAEDQIVHCKTCYTTVEQIWWKRTTKNAQWGDKDAVMVLVNNDPSCPSDVRVRYPGQQDCKVPQGYERVYLRNLQEVNRFEKKHGVANHIMHFDSNGRALDDRMG